MAAQQAQMAQQIQMQKLQAEIELAKARTMADKGLGIERISRVQENQALAEERKAAAVKDDYMALLSAVKAVKELEGLDLDALARLIEMKQMIHTEENVPQPVQGSPEQVDRGVQP